MNFEDVNTLLDYHYWARDRMLAALEPLSSEQFTQDLSNSFKSIRDTAAHIFAAELVWYSRWRGNSPKGLIAPETFPDVASLRKAWQDLEGEVRAFVKELGPDGINRRLPYKHFAGKDDTTVVWQMLQHVVNHGTYHRGQVTTLLRQLGLTPPKGMDLIFFYREREAQLAQGQSA